LLWIQKGTDVVERFKAEVMNSFCFERLRRKYKDFETLFLQKVIPVKGDLLVDGLKLSKDDEFRLINEVQVVFNSAASVDFNARLDDAIQANILGSLRVYNLAKKMVNLENFLHISTSYVNSNRKDGIVEEEIYYDQDKDDARVIIDRMLAMQLDEVNDPN
jgi:fatty acyl-CoA reductase